MELVIVHFLHLLNDQVVNSLSSFLNSYNSLDVHVLLHRLAQIDYKMSKTLLNSEKFSFQWTLPRTNIYASKIQRLLDEGLQNSRFQTLVIQVNMGYLRPNF